MKIKSSARAWIVRYTRPGNYTANAVERVWQINHCSIVIAETVEDALCEMRYMFPDATILSVNSGPIGQVMVDPDLVSE